MCEDTALKIDSEKLNRIYDKTRGKCHLCHKQLAFRNYAVHGAKGAWEIEHSKPKSCGGTDHLNNLFAACISCNREKGNRSNRSVRSKNGVRRAPLSDHASMQARLDNTIAGVTTGAAIGYLLGPGGAIVGAALGGLLGADKRVDE